MRRVALAVLVFIATTPPMAAQVSVLTEGIVERTALPGSTYEGVIRVLNTSDAPQEVRVYQTDYLFHADGTSRFDAPGTVARSNGPWVTYSPSRTVIPARGELVVAYTVAVPAADTLTGSYWSVFMVERVPPGSAESSRPPERSVGVVTVVREAVQLVTHISGTGAPALVFRDPRLLATEDGHHVLQVDLANEGSGAVRPEVRVELYDASGQPFRDVAVEGRMMYPGTATRHRLELGTVPPGRYQALVVADAGAEVFGAQYTLNF